MNNSIEDKVTVHKMNRREFLKLGSATLALGLLPNIPRSREELTFEVPASMGRIATGLYQAMRAEASPAAKWLGWKKYDEIIPLYAAIVGDAPWPSNPIWYQTEGGYVHSGYVQPVENRPESNIVTQIDKPGIWVQICVPIAECRWKPDSRYVARKLYYGTVYRAVQAVQDAQNTWWYQLQEGIAYSPGPYIPAWSAHYLQPADLFPLSGGRPDKRIEIDIKNQMLTCFEGENAVFSTATASGLSGHVTPRGKYRVLYKRPTDYMIGGSGDDYYNLPGVPFPTYFTWSGIAIHGTYWHNDYGRPKSHGCVNVTTDAAQWVFRWTDPTVPYSEYDLDAKPNEGTQIIVI